MCGANPGLNTRPRPFKACSKRKHELVSIVKSYRTLVDNAGDMITCGPATTMTNIRQNILQTQKKLIMG